MSEYPKNYDRVLWRKETILFCCIIARFISYAAAFVYGGFRGNLTVLGIWLLATYLSQFLATGLVDRIYGSTPGENRSYFRPDGIVVAVATVAIFLSRMIGL
jgi:phage-related holin